MKYLLVVLLLSLLAAVLVSAKPRRTGRPSNGPGNRYGHQNNRYGNYESDNDSDDDDDDNDGVDDNVEAERATGCYLGLMVCAQPLAQFAESIGPHNTTEFVRRVRELGARDTCDLLTTYGECVRTAAQDDLCVGSLPDEVQRILRLSLEYLDFTCVDKLDDLEAHWDCFTSQSVNEDVVGCKDEIETDLEQCRTDSLVGCVERAFNKSPECDDGASELFEQLVNKVLTVVPHCSNKKKVARALLHMFRKK